ncbi:hypothetical protein [Pseudonocardia acidicola]|uniref:hypothetical protein n=1 Tax=Pseudonocardia acidicola TaxID=2724939 RepID=UPI001B7D0A72|nr:hypothetical protein [Pseudonocardia acidicola]
MSRFARVLGVLTAAYGLGTLVRPSLLAGPAGLSPKGGGPSRAVATLVRAVGVREVASGLAIALAPEGRALQTALTFGFALPDRSAALTAVGIAGGGAR